MKNLHSFERTILTKIKSGSHVSIYGGNMSGKTGFMNRLLLLSENNCIDEFTIHYLDESNRAGMEDFHNHDFREYFLHRVFEKIESIGTDTRTTNIICLDHMGLYYGDTRLVQIQEALQNNMNKNIRILYGAFNDDAYNAYGFVTHYRIPTSYTEFLQHDFKGERLNNSDSDTYLDESDVVIFYININKERGFVINEYDTAFMDDAIRGNRRYIVGITHKCSSLVPRIMELKERSWLEDEMILMDYGGRFFKSITSRELMTISQKIAEYGIVELIDNIINLHRLTK